MSQKGMHCALEASVSALIGLALHADAADLSVPLSVGWNLLGNSTTAAIDVTSVLADKAKVTTVWKWDSTKSAWAFYSPVFASRAELESYAADRGYQVLSSVAPGQGFWVNAASSFTFGLSAITPYALGKSDLRNGWNLVATGNNVTPSAFNISLSAPPPSNEVPINLTTLWAWDSAKAAWYFYAPSLEATGGTALTDYIASKNYLDFGATGKKLGDGVGFWVNLSLLSTGVPLTWDSGNWDETDWQ